MVTKRVKRRAQAQTQERACKEAAKDEDVSPGSTRVARRNEFLVEVEGGRAEAGKQDGAGEVRPDVDGLVVQGEDGREGASVAVACRPVARHDKGIVTAPIVEVIPSEQEGGLDFLLDGFDCVHEAALG